MEHHRSLQGNPTRSESADETGKYGLGRSGLQSPGAPEPQLALPWLPTSTPPAPLLPAQLRPNRLSAPVLRPESELFLETSQPVIRSMAAF